MEAKTKTFALLAILTLSTPIALAQQEENTIKELEKQVEKLEFENKVLAREIYHIKTGVDCIPLEAISYHVSTAIHKPTHYIYTCSPCGPTLQPLTCECRDTRKTPSFPNTQEGNLQRKIWNLQRDQIALRNIITHLINKIAKENGFYRRLRPLYWVDMVTARAPSLHIACCSTSCKAYDVVTVKLEKPMVEEICTCHWWFKDPCTTN